MKKSGSLQLPRRTFERRPFTPWMYGPPEQTVGNSGLTQDEFLARGAEVRERLRRDRSDLRMKLSSEFADLPLVERRHRMAEAGGKSGWGAQQSLFLDYQIGSEEEF